MTHLQEWYEARKQCLEAPINDPDYQTKLNRLSHAEDTLYKHTRERDESFLDAILTAALKNEGFE